MVLTLLQIVKGEKRFTGKSIAEIHYYLLLIFLSFIHYNLSLFIISNFGHLSLLKRQRMNNFCGDVQPRVWKCAPV